MFCQSCGAQVAGEFCTKCGTRASQPSPPSAPPPAYTPPPAITVVDAQQVAKERLSQLGGAAQEHGKEAAKLAQQGIGAMAARMGKVHSARRWCSGSPGFFCPRPIFPAERCTRNPTHSGASSGSTLPICF